MTDETDTAPPRPLTFGDRERTVLEFERLGLKDDGRRDQAIKDRFGMSPVVYRRLLLLIIAMPEALVYDPQLVRRLQRIRDERRQIRPGRSRA